MTDVAQPVGTAPAPRVTTADAASSRWLPAAAFGAGFLVSVLGSWRPSLWTDEAATISAASRSLPQLVAMAHNIDAVHATYYAMMHLWLQLVPPHQFLLRLPSAVAVGLTTWLVLLLGRRLLPPTAALAAAGVFAVLPRTTWMGMEARPYAFTALLAAAMTLVLLLALVPRRRKDLALLLSAYALLTALAIAFNVYLALLLVAHGVSLLVQRTSWRLRWAWLLAGVVGVLICSPLVWVATHQTGQLGGGALAVGRVLRTVAVNQWFLGETPSLSTGAEPGISALWKLAAVALALVCWLLVVLGLVSSRRSVPVLVWALPWVVIPTALIALYSVGVHNMYNARYFAFATPGVALLIGHGLALLGARWRLGVAALLIAGLALPVYLSQRTVYAKSSTDWSGIAQFVDNHRGERQAVYFSPRYPITGPVVGQTARGVQTAYPAAFEGLRDVTLLRTPVQDANLSGSSLLLQDSLGRLQGMTAVWVIRRNDYAYAAQDDATLTRAGFAPGLRWDGPLDRVIEFTRV